MKRPSDLVVRSLAQGDLGELLRLYKQLQMNDPALPLDEARNRWHDILECDWLIYIGVFQQGTLLSTCHAAVIPNLTRLARPYAVIENVVTDEAARRRGHGRLAMQTLIDRCWKADCYKIMLASGAKRASVHAFYESLGFDRNAKQSFVLTR